MPLNEREYMRDPERTRAEQRRRSTGRTRKVRAAGERLLDTRWLRRGHKIARDADILDDYERDRRTRKREGQWRRVLRFGLVVIGFGVAGGIAATIVMGNLL